MKYLLLVFLFFLVGCEENSYELRLEYDADRYLVNEIDPNTDEVVIIEYPKVLDMNGNELAFGEYEVTGDFPNIMNAGVYKMYFDYTDLNGNIYETRTFEVEVLKRELVLNSFEVEAVSNNTFSVIAEILNTDSISFRMDLWINNEFYDSFSNVTQIDNITATDNLEVRFYITETRTGEAAEFYVTSIFCNIGE